MSEDAPPFSGFVAGSRIAGYLLEEQIGHGGMAVVFRAHDERLDRTVALKIMAPAFAQDEAFRQRFMRESRAAAAVDDPHIIPVFEAGDVSGVLFIAMRFVRGGDVRSLLSRTGPMAASQMAEIVSPVASALDAAHDAGLVHRDVKPANMLLDTRPGRPDHVYLSDFGLSKGAALATGLTQAGQFLGTLDYTAPEQIEGRALDGRADQYALACAVFELLSGEPPFRRARPTALVYAHLSEPPPRLSSRRPDLPAPADAVLNKALAKAPEDRYRTCGEFSGALRQALGISRYDSDPGLGPEPVRSPTQMAGQAPGTESQDTVAHPRVETTERGSQTEPRRTAPEPPAQAPVRRPRRGVLGFGAAAVAIIAVAVVIFAVTRGGGGPHPNGLPKVRSYSFVRSLADPTAAIIEGIAFSPTDSGMLAIADNDGGVYLWNAASGGAPVTIAGPASYGRGALAVAFSRDGSLLAAVFKNGDVVLWRVATRSRIGVVTDPSTGSRGAESVAFSTDGTMLASGDSNGTTYLWNVANFGTGQPVPLPDQGAGSQGVQGVAFSPDGRTLASGDSNGSCYLWDLSTRQASRLTDPGAGALGIEALAFGPYGRLFVTVDSAGRAIVWNAAARTVIATLRDPNTSGFGAVAVAISSHGVALAVGDGNGTTFLWNLRTRRPAGRLTDQNRQGVQGVAFNRDGSLLATADINGNVFVWKAR